MSKMPWIRFFPSDWLGGTRGMSAAETGIYITLIATMYERGEPVPEEHARLSRLCGASRSAFKAALDALIEEGKIVRVEGGLWNERVAKESEVRAEKSEVGRKSAEARWKEKDSKNNDSDDANAMRSQSVRNANQKPDTRNQKEEELLPDLPVEEPPDPEPATSKEKGGRASAAASSEFDQWYDAYPRHVGRGQAQKAYAAARKKAPAEVLLAAVRRAAASFADTEQKFIPYPATWLNGERWLDAQAPPVAAVPEVVADARAYGWPVSREGNYWRVAGALYDDAGEQIGN